MPIVSSIQRDLELSDVGTRIRVSSVNSTPMKVVVRQEGSVAYPDGFWAEVVNVGANAPGQVSIEAEFGVTVNALSGTMTIGLGQYARLSKVSGVVNTWDLSIHASLPTTSTYNQVLKSTGVESGAYWATPDPVPPPAVVYRLTNSGPGSFGGSTFTAWTAQQIDQNMVFPPMISWNGLDNTFEIDDPYSNGGMWEVMIEGQLSRNSGNIPDGLITYGVQLTANNGAANQSVSEHVLTRYTDPAGGVPNGSASIGTASGFGASASNNQTFNARFIVTASGSPTSSVAPALFAYAYNDTSAEYSATMMLTFRRLGDYTNS